MKVYIDFWKRLFFGKTIGGEVGALGPRDGEP